jgi:hypothetical protein
MNDYRNVEPQPSAKPNQQSEKASTMHFDIRRVNPYPSGAERRN